jgi:hypothetical protein
MYVAVSRAKLGVQIFCEDKDSMTALASLSKAKLSAIDIALKEGCLIHKEREIEIAKINRTMQGSLAIETQKPELTQQINHSEAVGKRQTQRVAIENDYSIGM